MADNSPASRLFEDGPSGDRSSGNRSSGERLAGERPSDAGLFDGRPTPRTLSAWLGLPEIRDSHAMAAAIAVFAFVAMVLFGPIMTLKDTVVGYGDQGSTVRQVGYLAIFALALWAAEPMKHGWRVLALPVPIVAALTWCWLSVIWAIEPGISFRRNLLNTIVVWICFILARGAGYRLTMATVRIALMLALVLNYLMVFIDPQTAIQSSADDINGGIAFNMWAGFMAHKNFAGAACALTIIMFLFDCDRMARSLRWAVIVLAAIFLYKSHSKTSFGLIVPAAAAAWVFMRAAERFRIYAVPAIVVGTSLLWMVYSFFQDSINMSVLGPTAFTGRGAIWTALLRYAGDHPLLGSGFGSFWDIGEDSPIYAYGAGFVTKVAVGHDGYLDLAVAIGVPGLILVVFAMICWPMIQMLTWRGVRIEAGGLLCALLAFSIGHNVTESTMFERDAIVGMFMLFAVAFIDHYASRGRSRRREEGSAGDALMSTMRRRKRRTSASGSGRSGGGGSGSRRSGSGRPASAPAE